MFEGIIANVAASVVGSYVKKGVSLLTMVPKPVWEALAVIGYVLALFGLHQHYANQALKAADKAGYERRLHEDEKVLAAMRKRAETAETNFAKIAQEERTKNDQDNARSHAVAASLLVRGPGAAAAHCGPAEHSVIPAASGQSVTPAQQPGPAPDRVPASDGSDALALVPWRWLVGTGEQCDVERSENVAWRSWYPRVAAEQNKLRQPLASQPK